MFSKSFVPKLKFYSVSTFNLKYLTEMSPYFKTLNEIKIQTFPIYKFKKMLFRFFWVRGDTDREVTLATK